MGTGTRPLRRRLTRTAVATIAVLALLMTAFMVWAYQVMPGDRDAALTVWRDDRVQVRDVGNSIRMIPAGHANGTGVVFFPGAKVDPYAYMATFRDVVAAGTTVVITKPWFNLAIMDTRPLSTFESHAPSVRTWAVGGHSLGGTRACQLATINHTHGLLLLGSYCVNNLRTTHLTVLSISGSRDGLSTPTDIRNRRPMLPTNATMIQIPGANHADFGHYGPPPGDNPATITHTTADHTITTAINRWINTLTVT